MIKIYLFTVTILLTLLTITVGILKPEINKPVRFASNDFQISNTELAAEPDATHKFTPPAAKIINTEPVEIKTIEKKVQQTPQTKKTTQIFENKNNQTSKTVNIKPEKENIKNSTKTVTTKPVEPQNKTITQKPAQNPVETVKTAQIPQSVKDIINNSQKTVSQPQPQPQEQNEKIRLPQIDPSPKPAQKTIETIPENERPLTEQEEIIVWNTWRSNLQNRIMSDTEIYAPIGTAFKFSFTVDKKGRISNLRTWAVPSNYNTVAVNYLKPLILQYMNANDPILNFPARTKRVITNVTGGFVISTQDRFSTPNDFSDIEKIKTLR